MTEETTIKNSNSSNRNNNEKSQQNVTTPTTKTTTTTATSGYSAASVTNTTIAEPTKIIKVRRAFSMPRNPFRSKKYKINNLTTATTTTTTTTTIAENDKNQRNSQNLKPNEIIITNNCEGNDVTISNLGTTTTGTGIEKQDQQQQQQENQNKYNNFTNRIFRRSSFRKFLSRIAHHVTTSVNISANKLGTSSPATENSSADRVPPIINWPSDQTPGVTGLKNHGNTCFMNSVLQCLSHTDILAEYFVLDQYKADLKRRNKINSKKFGTKGELTEQLANVLKALWTCKNESDHSTSFKAVVDRYGVQFRSSTQHDAQEFLFWLLDKVHEDLNTASKRRYKTVKNNYGRPDEIIAAETLANHIRCNNSFVQAVFQAQFRSSLTCPRCKKQSNTFDPFHCISVQLPQLHQQTIFVTVVYMKKQPRQVKYGLSIPSGSPIVALREKLQLDTGIPSNQMILVDINETGFSRVFYDSQPISMLDGSQTIYCIEVPDIKTNEKNSNELMLLVANVKKQENGNNTRFSTPFCLQVNRDCSYSELQKKLLKEMSSIIKPEVFSYATPLNEMFQIRVQDPAADPDTYLEQVEHPLFMEIIDTALSVLSTEIGPPPPHIKLLLEWKEEEKFFSDLDDPIVEHESVAKSLEKKQAEAILTLEQCLEHYTKAETLSAEDAWRCPNCQQYLPVVKTLGLWSLPDILVIHFKRFRQQHEKGPAAAKLTTMVEFPLEAFDMSPHLARGTQNSGLEDLRSPWRRRKRLPGVSTLYHDHHSHQHSSQKDTRYDLYAVCYHQGDTLETGHYTAACKNPYDSQWYKFDDQRVSLVSGNIEEEIVNHEAYILFYQRRTNDLAECSSNSTNSDHWVSKIAPTIPPPSKQQPQLLDISKPKKTDDSLIDDQADDNKKLETVKPIPSVPTPPPVVKLSSGSVVLKEDEIIDEKVLMETTTAIVVEKTDEIEEVDVEGLEFVDEYNILQSVNTTEKFPMRTVIENVVVNGNSLEKPNEISREPTNALVFLKNEKCPSIESITSSSAIRATTNGYFDSTNIGTSSINIKEVLSSSLRSNHSDFLASSHCVNLRHSFSTSSNYKLKDCNDTFSSMLRNTASSCSKDTLIYIDQKSSRNLMNDEDDDSDDSYLGSRSLWISPVTPHKLITVSPKN